MSTLLAALPVGHRLDAERTARAQRYAYHFFFRRMIELPGLRRAASRARLTRSRRLACRISRRAQTPHSIACAMVF